MKKQPKQRLKHLAKPRKSRKPKRFLSPLTGEKEKRRK